MIDETTIIDFENIQTCIYIYKFNNNKLGILTKSKYEKWFDRNKYDFFTRHCHS